MENIKVIMPKEYGEDIKTALEEVTYFLGLVGVMVMQETGDAKWTLSLGNTELAKEYNLIGIADDLYDDGFVIKTINNTWFIIAPDERGVLFGGYELLKELCSLEVYASEEFEIKEFRFLEVNKKVNPSLAYRARGWYPWNKYDVKIKNRLRYTEPNWITFAHTMLSILPKSKYYDEHPDYYSTANAMQLCFTNEEMTEAFIKESLENYIKIENMRGKRTAIFFVGQEDNGCWCQCKRCQEAYKKLGLTATMQLFVKKVAKAVNEHVEKTMPGKIVKTLTFAYGGTNEFPVDENYKPIDDSLYFEKNMGVMITVGTHNFSKDRIERNERYLKACKALGGEAYLWSYDSIFDDELIYVDTFDYAKYYNKMFIENGAMMHYDQGHYNANIAFDELSNYVRAKLMWDVSLDEQVLINDFIRAFYKEGENEVRQYREEIKDLQKTWGFEANLFVRTSPEIKEKKAFPQDKLRSWIELLSKGLDKVKENRVKLRIARERLTPMYLLVELYGEELTREELENIIEIFQKDVLENNVAYYAEHGPENFNKDMHAKLTQWRSLLL